jgi:hypothetical protein
VLAEVEGWAAQVERLLERIGPRLPGPKPARDVAPWPASMQLPDDAAEHLPVVAPGLAAPAVGG